MTISQKVMVPNIVLILMLIGIFLFQSNQLRDDQRVLVTASQQHDWAANILSDLAVSQARIVENLFFFRLAPSENVLLVIEHEERVSQNLIAEMGKIEIARKGKKLLKRFVDRRAGIDGIRADLIAAITANDPAKVEGAYVRWSIKVEQIDATLADLTVYNSKSLDRTQYSINQNRERFNDILAILIGVTSIVVISSFFYYRRLIVIPLNELDDLARSYSKGDFGKPVSPRLASSQDALGNLSRTMAQMGQDILTEQLRIRLITDALPVLIAELDNEYRYRFANRAYLDWNDIPEGTIVGRRLDDVLGQAVADKVRPFVARGLANERVSEEVSVEFTGIGQRDVEATYIPHVDDQGEVVGCFVLVIDLTDRKQAELQLQQAQKMEAVGQLTGGVAHDFNNLLTILMGNLDIMQDYVTEDTAKKLLRICLGATQRGANLTHQLLAFSRKQPLAPESTNTNDLLSMLNELLRRTLGENVEIETVFVRGLWRAMVDPVQLEHAIINLAINARDAMPEGGKLTLETANIFVDEDIDGLGDDLPRGRYVMIAVSDTGTGMTSDVMEQAFDPFFTTKDIGEGSGLGLSMVYGFAKQSGGLAAIYTEVGQGTTVKIYLPKDATDDPAEEAEEEAALPRGDIPTGNETILVVEDEADVLTFVAAALRSAGFTVLEAADGPAAVAIAEATEDLDLLLTDVVLPFGMTGRQVADRIQEIKPGLKTLFTSGYAKNAIVHQGRLDEGVELLTKPYTRDVLVSRVRFVLDDPGK